MSTINLYSNAATKTAKPQLSILVPFYKDNPADLLSALAQQIEGETVELLLYDDGTDDTAVNERLMRLTDTTSAPVTLMLAQVNKGRSAARNALQKTARADWVLFLDADMMPESDSFITDYLALINADVADIVFGGFTMPATASKETALHRAFSESSDCLTAAQRAVKGPQYVCSSNLCVRSSILKANPFDTGFSGWGWEDSEWAARVADKYRLLHADIPAKHLGLESTETLLARFRDSAANYDRFTAKHPELARRLTLFKMMHMLRRVPGQKLMRPALSALVKNKIAIVPMKLRLLALKLWRASWYAERCQP